MRTIGLLCAVSLALAVSACGGSSDDGSSGAEGSAAASDEPVPKQSGVSDEEAVKETIRAYGAAVVDGDAGEACDLVTDELQRAIVTQVSAQLGSVDSCEDAINAGSEGLSEEAANKLGDLQFESVSIQGAGASVRVKDGFGTPRLTKRSGSWLISKLR